MNQKKKAQAAQISVLLEYGVLADFSGATDEVLAQFKTGVTVLNKAEDLTFANWCNQVLGDGVRLPVARFDPAVPGKTRIGRLVDGADFAQGFQELNRAQQQQIRALKKEIRKLETALHDRSPSTLDPDRPYPASPDTLGRELCNWYSTTSQSLRLVLADVKEVEGVFLNPQGHLNRDYRESLVESIMRSLEHLASLDFSVEVRLQAKSRKPPILPPILLFKSHRHSDIEGYNKGFSLVVENVEPDIIEFTRLYSGRHEMPNLDDLDAHLDCEVSVAAHERLPLSEDEIFHLSCFLQKLFSALAKSGNHRPRGNLREQILLCLLLSWTAPCMTARAGLEHKALHLAAIPHDGDTPPSADLSAAKITDHLFSILDNHVVR